MTCATATRRALSLACLLLFTAPAAATASEIMVYNETAGVIEELYARPLIAETEGQAFLGFPLGAGPIAPGASKVVLVTEEFCEFELVATFQGSDSASEHPSANVCWTPIVVVQPDYITLQ